jgi:tetratricopeptide (TPR) repeat protein
MTYHHHLSRLSPDRVGGVALLAWLALLAAPRDLPAQVSVRDLVGREMDEVGPEGEHLVQGLARFAQADTDGARSAFVAAVEKNDKLPPADILMARLYRASNKLAEARGSLDKASVEAPDDPEAFVGLGELAFGENRLAEADPLFAKALQLCDAYRRNPKRQLGLKIRALAGIAAVHEKRRQWDEAEQTLAGWIEIDPNNPLAQTRLGRAQFEQEKYKEAYATLTQLHEENDAVPRPEINMALLYEQASLTPGKEKLHENAQKLMNLAVQRVPNHLETRLAATQWGLESGLLDFAKTSAQAALSIDPNSLPAKIAVGVVARHEQDYGRAEELFTAAHLDSPTSFAALNNLALTLIEQSDVRQRRRALEFAQVSMNLYPDLRQATGREAAVTLAWILHNAGRHAEAQRYLAAAARAGTISSESTYFAAVILAAQGRSEAASRLLGSVVNGRRAFPHRADAETLLEKFRKSSESGAEEGDPAEE